MDGQISIFDLGVDKPDIVSPAEQWFNDTGLNDYWQTDTIFINDRPVCKHSKHSCNRLELFKVADSLDDINCKKVCCRKCDITGCGARCNGSEEPKVEDIKKSNVNTCECGNNNLAITFTGCGIPNNFTGVITYDNYLFCVFCPKCFRVATANIGWRSNKSSIDEAINDWNKNPHKLEKNEFILGRYGLKYYADNMDKTIERFPDARKVLNG